MAGAPLPTRRLLLPLAARSWDEMLGCVSLLLQVVFCNAGYVLTGFFVDV